jgi:hypothetical protein
VEHREQHEEECKIREVELPTENYFYNPTRLITETAQSASCRCRLIYESLDFIPVAK